MMMCARCRREAGWGRGGGLRAVRRGHDRPHYRPEKSAATTRETLRLVVGSSTSGSGAGRCWLVVVVVVVQVDGPPPRSSVASTASSPVTQEGPQHDGTQSLQQRAGYLLDLLFYDLQSTACQH